ncbi:MAG: flagellar FliJ family protein, partial [Myxococcales bacterium]|nr:flagellar FliJ family protein [Myxococcales bacterium]
REEINRRAHQLAQLDAEFEAAQAKVAAAWRALRAIEVLEERDRAAWKLEMGRAEQQEADERNAQRFGRDDS